ncbi:MAG: sialate O-acetylesterase, partial [Bacteroidetes bacterium]|nr:sialate O-acetylesterase [Bacteroidota bacterium]
MKKYIRNSGILLFCLIAICCNRKEKPQSGNQDRENFHLFLLVGQSNMAGRGLVEQEDTIPYPRVLTLTKDENWAPAIDPIHFDKKVAGVGPGRTFGITLAERNKEITIGLIPCATGGSPISVWKPGQEWYQTQSYPYDDAIRRTKRAIKDGVLKGILWHQGSSDCKPGLAEEYEKNLKDLIKRFREDINAPNVPFIIGKMGQFPGKPLTPSEEMVNEAHLSIAKESKLNGFVSSDGLTFNSDSIHFDAISQREFGRRYAEVYLKVAEQITATY